MGINKILASFLSVYLCISSAVSYASYSDETYDFFGDVDLNGTIDSVDASLILGEYSVGSTGGTSTLNATQKKCADVDRNSTIDSVDASHILAYYAYISTGGTSGIVDFIDGEYEAATTTTTTTTTKKPETTTTQAPVIEYKLENIGISADVFRWHAINLKKEIMEEKMIGTSYADYTAGGNEATFLLAMLNDGKINDEVLAEVFSDYTKEDMKNYTEFVYSIVDIQEMVGTGKIDYENYTLDKNIGSYINKIDDAYRECDIEGFLEREYMNCEMQADYYYNPAIISMMCSYDRNNIYLYDFNADDLCVNDFIDRLLEKTKGISYTR